jgi:hypothetical protein
MAVSFYAFSDAVKDLVFLGCGVTSLGDWRTTFQDSMVITSLRIQEGFILNVSILEDESTITPVMQHHMPVEWRP